MRLLSTPPRHWPQKCPTCPPTTASRTLHSAQSNLQPKPGETGVLTRPTIQALFKQVSTPPLEHCYANSLAIIVKVLRLKHNSMLTPNNLFLSAVFVSAAGLCAVKIASVAVNAFVNIAEVQLYNAGGVLIPTSSLTPTLSTTLLPYVAAWCVDGNLNTFCHTNFDTAPMLSIGYPCSGGLSRVHVFNRVDCCQSRIAQFQLQFTNGAGEAVGSTYTFEGGTFQHSIPAPAGECA